MMNVPAQAELVLGVDFGTQDRAVDDTGFSPNRVQPGFEDFSVGPERSGSRGDGFVVIPPIPTVTRTFGAYQVTITDTYLTSNGLFFDDFGTVEHELGPLADGYVRSSGPDLLITIKGLTAGNYSVTTYHHHALPLDAPRFVGEILATSNGVSTPMATHIPISSGLNPGSVSSSTFDFVTDGLIDTQIIIRQERPFSGALLNGFEISRIPEPTSLTICTVLIAVLMAVYRHGRQ